MAFLIVFASIITIVSLSVLLYKKRHQRYYDLLKQFPSPPTYPIVGNLKPSHLVIDDFMKTVKEVTMHHDRVIYWIGPKPILLLKKFDDISVSTDIFLFFHSFSQWFFARYSQIVLNQNAERHLSKLTQHWFGTAILNNTFAEWKKSRKLIIPAFSSEMLEKYCEVLNRKSSALVDKLKLFADSGEEVDVRKYLLNNNIEGLLENITGVSIQTKEKEIEEFGDAIEEFILGVGNRALSPWLYPDAINSMYMKLTGKIKLVKKLHRLPTQIVRENLKDVNEKYHSEKDDSSKRLIDLMRKARIQDSTFTETRLKDELLQLTTAACDASSMNTSFTLLMLALHQDAQQKVYEEITQLVSEHEVFTSDHLCNHLKYLEQCIRETLRMYDPAALSIRKSQKEHVLKDNTIIPSDMIIVIMFHLANQDTALYKNPHKWNPENFSEQATASRPKGSHLSFSMGPRSCPGYKYAILLNKSQIAQIIRCYHVKTSIKELNPDDLKMEVAIKSKIGYPIRFTPRKKTGT
uniref:Cytochrome P450 4461J3 n=1 Tax=Maconellicoccus hirsutus TaxID=177089 RepID=A0AAT9UTQ9_MACHI